MVDLKVEAKVPKNEKKGVNEEKSAILTVKFPDIDKDPKAALAEAVDAFGEKAILSNAKANWVVTLQSTVRSRLLKGKTTAEIQAELGNSKLGVAAAKVAADPKQTALAYLSTLTPEEKKAFIQSLMK